MMVNNLNNTQNKFNDFSNSNNIMYQNLINEFENYLLTENKKLSMIDYLKNNCDINFSNDVINILENFNYVISQAIQVIRTLLSEKENLKNKNLNNEYNNYYNKFNNNNSYNFNNNLNYNYNNYNNNDSKGMNQSNNFNNFNFNDNKNNSNYNNNSNNENIISPLKYDYNKGYEVKNNEPLKKPLREQLKKMSKDNITNTFNINNLTNNSNSMIQNLNDYSNDGKNSLRMVLNNQISNLNKSNNNILENNSINNLINNNQNLSFYNSNKKTYESNSNNNVKEIRKKREIDILKVTNEILKLINIANKKKKYLVEKYINSSTLNYDNDYKEFLDRIINYKYDIITLNNILKDLKDSNLNSRKTFYNNKKDNNSKETIKNNSIEHQTITEANEAFKKNLRKYSYPSLTNKTPFINATNPYSHLFS